MEKVKSLMVYNLVNDKGDKLQLELGITKLNSEDRPWASGDTGYRWRFIGKHIPMPVRSRYWFNGFAETIMLDWLKGNGWYVRTRVDVACGYAKVFELPDTLVKGDLAFPAHCQFDKKFFEDVIRDLVLNGTRVAAIRLYQYVHGGSLDNATEAVREIVDQQA